MQKGVRYIRNTQPLVDAINPQLGDVQSDRNCRGSNHPHLQCEYIESHLLGLEMKYPLEHHFHSYWCWRRSDMNRLSQDFQGIMTSWLEGAIGMSSGLLLPQAHGGLVIHR